jgi:hypothetical protein
MSEITNLIYKYANSFDSKSWDNLKTILADEVICDYQDLRGTYATLTATEFIEKRKQALQHLKTQHLFANLEIYQTSMEATCICTAFILRRANDEIFNTHALYEFSLTLIENVWRIVKIKQTVLWNEGNSMIHSGAASKSR